MIAEEKLHFSLRFDHDEHATVHHQVDIGPQKVDHLYGLVHLHTFGHIDEEPILCQHRVESGHGIAVCGGDTGVISTDELGLFTCCLVQRAHPNALGEFVFGQMSRVESIVHHDVVGGAEVGNVATEHLVGIHRDG